ncbi:MAG: tRNA (guanosine(46)-N7)-methyltransferase TrmB [Chitinophagaceae bacterium]|nr:tRNA (guanosine(46)-N7)-methyltransferase TrmB [Chitinophagaceae bacterium]
MGQKKLIRFAEILNFPNVFQYPVGMQGKWKDIFKNEHGITLELACGKGEYTLGLARMFPDRNFMGIDMKGNRLWVGAKTAIKENLSNVLFLRTHIDKLNDYFQQGDIDEIWITFPDPQLRLSKLKKRLTHPKFLRLYQTLLRPGGFIHLKTDSPVLYDFTLKVLDLYNINPVLAIDDLYSTVPEDPIVRIQTHYEKLDIANSNRIHYVKFKLPIEPLADIDKQLKDLLGERETA